MNIVLRLDESDWNSLCEELECKMIRHEISSKQFCKLLFLYGWACSKHLHEHNNTTPGPSSPVLSQDSVSSTKSSYSFSHSSSSDTIEPARKVSKPTLERSAKLIPLQLVSDQPPVNSSRGGIVNTERR